MITLILVGSIVAYLFVAGAVARKAYSDYREEAILEISQETVDAQVPITGERKDELMREYERRKAETQAWRKKNTSYSHEIALPREPTLVEWAKVPKFPDPVSTYVSNDQAFNTWVAAAVGLFWAAWLVPYGVISFGKTVITGKPRKSSFEKDLEIKKKAEYISALEKEVFADA